MNFARVMSLSLVLSFFVISMNVQAVSVSSLLVKPTTKTLTKVIGRLGVKDAAVDQAVSTLKLAVKGIVSGELTEAKLIKAYTKAFQKSNPEILQILAKDEAEVTKDELIILLKASALEAELAKGGHICGSCAEKELVELGIKNILVETPENMVRHMNAAPQTYDGLLRKIKSFAKKFKLEKSDYDSFVDPKNLVNAKRKRVFAQMRMVSKGTKEQRAFGQALSSFNTVGDKTYYSQSGLMGILSTKMSDEQLNKWTEVLKMLTKDEPLDQDLGRISNLRKYLEDKAKVDSELEDELRFLKENNCWSIF